MSVLSSLDLHPCLRARIHRVHPAPPPSKVSAASNHDTNADDATAPSDGFVLYLPTVCLRIDQNPAFALACRAANKLNVPLVVIAVVVDDASHVTSSAPHRAPPLDSNSSLSSSVVMTSRRLAFTLQALSHACAQWSSHGAAVGVRIHAPNVPKSSLKGARTPDHLTLAARASLVVTDEPFVSPFSTLVQRVEAACRKSNVECVRVDGSCTVPPVQVLKRRPAAGNNGGAGNNDGGSNGSPVKYDGVPGKAYLWQRKTERLREGHLKAAMEGGFDAPELNVRLEDEDLFAPLVPAGKEEEESSSVDDTLSVGRRLAHLFPSRWKPKANSDGNADSPLQLPSAPDVRPYTSHELSRLYQDDSHCTFGSESSDTQQQSNTETKQGTRGPFHNFALNWPGADPTVPPCPQTVGTAPHGTNRWNAFFQKISRYGRERNDARKVHSPSRMSAYLNLGIVSVFRCVWEVIQQQKQDEQARGGTKPKSKWDKSGADKFEEEIVKFREHSYAHAFSREDYDDVGSLPSWSVACLNDHSGGGRYTLERLASGNTGDAKWDAMQRYLVKMGELHNNVRMTWGKTVVEWVGCARPPGSDDSSTAQLMLRALCYLNDRYALDGLSPPSYAGLLWCMGWTDKPSGGGGWTISKKPAYRYKMNPDDFVGAERKLLASRSSGDGGEGSSASAGVGLKRKRSVLDMMKMQSTSGSSSAASAIDLTASDDETSKAYKESAKSSDASKGMKRNGSFTIDSFFAKSPKKAAWDKAKQVIG